MLLLRVRETPLESPQARKTNLKNCPGALLLLRLLPAAFFLSAIEACSPFVNDVPQTSRTFAPFQACNWTNRARATPLELLQTQNTDLKKNCARYFFFFFFFFGFFALAFLAFFGFDAFFA